MDGSAQRLAENTIALVSVAEPLERDELAEEHVLPGGVANRRGAYSHVEWPWMR